MKKSLQDQLLKAGLATDKQLKQVKQSKKKQPKRKKGAKVLNEVSVAVQKAQAEKAAHDKLLNQERVNASQLVSQLAEVKQLINVHKLSLKDRIGAEEKAVIYQFSHKSKIKKLRVSPVVFNQLVQGSLAVVLLEDQFELVGVAVAEKIRQRHAEAVIVFNPPALSSSKPPIEVSDGCDDTDQNSDDDPYAGYDIPDDLMW